MWLREGERSQWGWKESLKAPEVISWEITEAQPGPLVSKQGVFPPPLEGMAPRWQELVWTSLTGEEARLDSDGSL